MTLRGQFWLLAWRLCVQLLGYLNEKVEQHCALPPDPGPRT